MKKRIVLFLVVGVLAGMAYSQIKLPPVPKTKIELAREMILRPNKDWVEIYGDSLESQLIFNIRVLIAYNNEIYKDLAELKLKLDTPKDPNEVKDG